MLVLTVIGQFQLHSHRRVTRLRVLDDTPPAGRRRYEIIFLGVKNHFNRLYRFVKNIIENSKSGKRGRMSSASIRLFERKMARRPLCLTGAYICTNGRSFDPESALVQRLRSRYLGR